MGRTNYIENIQQCGNLDTDLGGDSTLAQKNNIRKIVLLDGENTTEFIKDEIDITYFRDLLNDEREPYTDEDGNTGYKQTYNFGREDFAGTIKTVCLANADFIDPRRSNTFSNSSGNTVSGSGSSYVFSNSEALNNYTRALDINYESGKILTFTVKKDNGEYALVFAKWNHNFRNFRIGGAASYFYLDEIVSVDITDLISTPDGEGHWTPVTSGNIDAMMYFGIDEENNKYVFIYTTKTKKVLSTLIVDKEDLTQTELHQMILPNEADWASNTDWHYFNSSNGYNSRYGMFYKGRFCMPLDIVREEGEQEISGVAMCSINYKNSTDIKALETHCYNTSGEEVDWNSNMPSQCGQPLINSGCGSAISNAWTIKNNVAYIKQGGAGNWGFYYKGLILSTEIDNNTVTLMWRTCPYCISIYEVLTKPFLKTLNKTLKYTFNIVNTGGYFR